MMATGPRYVVEPGTDGSWLVVDRGDDRRGRRAIHRGLDERAVRSEAETLSALQAATDDLPESQPALEFDAMSAAAFAHSQEVDAAHGFDHLLQPRPGRR